MQKTIIYDIFKPNHAFYEIKHKKQNIIICQMNHFSVIDIWIKIYKILETSSLFSGKNVNCKLYASNPSIDLCIVK